jgi:four helix bundle protein
LLKDSSFSIRFGVVLQTRKNENPPELRLRTKEFALRVIRLFRDLPKSSEAQIIGKQVFRSATSVGANYQEAFRARSRAEFIAKCGDSLREIGETGYWLELLEGAGIISSISLAPLRQECHELTAIFVSIVRSAKSADKSETS